MYGRIILGVDGTDQSRDALELARLLASKGGRSVVVSHVIPHPQPYDSRTREYVKLVQEHVRSLLDPAVAALSGLRVEARPIESRSVARGLYELAEAEGVSLLVIGSTHRGPMGRVLLGSVGEILLSGTRATVAVAPKGFAERERRGLEVIGAGFNGSSESKAALRTAAAVAAEAGGTLRAFAVDEDFLHDRRPLHHNRDRHDLLAERLDRALAEVGASDAERVLLSGGAASCLAECCADTDLLVIGSRSYGPLHHALLGSVSAKLMRSCPAPLLVVPRGAELPESGFPAGAAARTHAQS